MNIIINKGNNEVVITTETEILNCNYQNIKEFIAISTAILGDEDFNNCYNKEIEFLNSDLYFTKELKKLSINQINQIK